jgi:hypothetical protein
MPYLALDLRASAFTDPGRLDQAIAKFAKALLAFGLGGLYFFITIRRESTDR